MLSESKTQWLLYVVGFLYFAVSNLSRMFQHAGLPREAMYIVFLVFLAWYFAKNLRAIGVWDIVYYVVVAPLTIHALMKYASCIESRTSLLSVLILYLPAYLFFRLFPRHEDILAKCVMAAAWYAALYLFPYYIFFVRGNLTYSMSYAYWVSFPICMLLHGFLETRRWRNLLVVLLLYATLIVAGCRGALLLTTLLCFFAVLGAALRHRWNLTSGRILWILAGIAALVLLLASMDSLLSFLEKYSGVSRNISRFFEGTYLESTQRDSIYQVCRELIEARPSGYGALASRELLVGHNYPHSLWYELQLDYGNVFGIALFCGLSAISIGNVLAYRNTKLSMLVAYLAIVGMGSLMLSSSYYYEMYVPAMCGLFVSRFYASSGNRRQAPWHMQGEHSPPTAPRQAAGHLPQAAPPAPEGDSRKAVFPAFPGLAGPTAATVKHGTADEADAARTTPQPPPGHSAASFPSSQSPATAAPSAPTHHRRHPGGRRHPPRRFFDKTVRCLPWILGLATLALAFAFGIPVARRAWGQHCMDRGLRLAASRSEAAFRSFQAARKSNAPGSDVALMLCRQLGIGCAADPGAAAAAFETCRWTYETPGDNLTVRQLAKLLQFLADAQDPNAQYLLGRMHEEGKGFPQPDPAAARHRMEQAVAHGQPQAIQWMLDRARGGDADAQVLLGRLYLDGNGPAGHDAESVRWVLQATNRGSKGGIAWIGAQARAGNPAAQYILGRKAEARAQKAGTRDFAPALDWYRQAAAQGHAEAQAAVERLSGGD